MELRGREKNTISMQNLNMYRATDLEPDEAIRQVQSMSQMYFSKQTEATPQHKPSPFVNIFSFLIYYYVFLSRFYIIRNV